MDAEDEAEGGDQDRGASEDQAASVDWGEDEDEGEEGAVAAPCAEEAADEPVSEAAAAPIYQHCLLAACLSFLVSLPSHATPGPSHLLCFVSRPRRPCLLRAGC